MREIFICARKFRNFLFSFLRSIRGWSRSSIVQSKFRRDSLLFFFVFKCQREESVDAKMSHSAIWQDNLTEEFGDVEVLLFIKCHIIDLFRIKLCESSKILGIVCCSGICRCSDLTLTFIRANFDDAKEIALYFFNFISSTISPFCTWLCNLKTTWFWCYRWIASQNCGRQPHIVSTNHSNLIAVGPNRSLASRQAIVWTYRPRVETTESQLPDFSLRIEAMKWKTNKHFVWKILASSFEVVNVSH